MRNFKDDTYPPAPYRVNVGLKLCKQNMAADEIILDSIPIVTLPNKLENGEEEFFDTEGMNVRVKNNDVVENSNNESSSSL